MSLPLRNKGSPRGRRLLTAEQLLEGRMAPHLTCWLMEYSTEMHRQPQAASCFSKGLFCRIIPSPCSDPTILLWGPAVLTVPFTPIQLLSIKSPLVRVPWGSVHTGRALG